MRNKLTVTVILIASLVFASMSLGAISAEAKPSGPANTCEPKKAASGYSGKIDVQGKHKSVTVTAPAGSEIYRFCAKAGSAKQGHGPEYRIVDPAQSSVTISHSSGKDLSHYAYWYRPTATTSTTVPATTSTTVPATTSTTVPATTSTTVPATTSTTVPATTSTTVPSTTVPSTTVPETTSTTVPETTSTTVPETTSTTVLTYTIPPLVWERTPTPTPPAPVAPPAKISVTG